MLKTTPLELLREIGKAKELADKINKHREDMIRAYAGEYYRDDWVPTRGKVIDNRFDEWLRMVLPQIVFDNPKASVKTNRSGVNPTVPRALEAALNWWAPQVNLYKVLSLVAYDAAFTYGVILTTYGPPPGREPWLSDNDEDAMGALPRVSRIDPRRWFCDHTIDHYDPATGQGRLAGHMFRADKEDLLRDKRFNAWAVEQCSTGEGRDKWGGEKSDREEIYGYEVWVPEIQTGDDPDAHGTIFTLGLTTNTDSHEDAAWLREPRPFIGPADGPYTLFGMGVMPGCPYPYSPFAASWDQIRLLNKAVEASERSAERHKRFLAVDSTNTQAADALRKVKDGEVVLVRGLGDGDVKEMTLGGGTPEQADHIQRRGEQVDRSLNLSETARGNVNVDTSATAIADAASQRAARLSSMKRLMTDGAAQVLRSAAWHLYTHPDAVFFLPPDVAESFIPRPKYLPDPAEAEDIAIATGSSVLEVRRLLEHQPEVLYAGGPSDQVITEIENDDDGSITYVISPYVNGLRYEDFELEIEPHSMERVDEALLQRRAMQVFEVVSGALPLIIAYPDARWEGMIDMIGEPMNMPNLSERVLGRRFLSKLRAAAEGQSSAQGAGPPGASSAMPLPQPGTDGADGMDGRLGEAVYGGGDLAQASRR